MSYNNPSIMASDSNHHGRHGMGPAYAPSQGTHDVAVRGMHYTAAHPDGLSGVVSAFGNINLANSNNLPQGAAPVAMPPNGYMHDGPVVGYPGYAAQQPSYIGMPQVADPYNTGVPGNTYMAQGGVPYAQYIIPYTPARNYPNRIDRELRNVPDLDNRRSSYSTTATESTPGTPFFGGMNDRHSGGPRVISADRSSYTTPSPQALAVSGTIGPVTTKGKRIADAELHALNEQDPPIPAAVPAVFTTPEQRKSLDQCLENRIDGNKNVYIRGLHPTTDDELLSSYASRFGEVEQSKAIIDTATGACKG